MYDVLVLISIRGNVLFGYITTISVLPDPVDLFNAWLAEAEKAEPADANAMVLASVGDSGQPSARVVLLRGVDARGFVFYTNLKSRKGQELLAHQNAALNFYWKSLNRQVRIEGQVEMVADEEADAYFASRPRLSKIGAWASEQSALLDSMGALEERVAAFEEKYPGDDIPRPTHWSGFRLVHTYLEFWDERPYRLHERVCYTRDGDSWVTKRLYP